MQTLNVALGSRSYPIYIGAGLLGRAELIVERLAQGKAAIVTNATVAALYLPPLKRALEALGVTVVAVTLPDGEEHKTWETLNRIFDELLEHRCERGTALIALGGGVVGDLAGFAAAVYQRGVPYIQVPATLLAQVDSAVGGKTAINHPRGKNMIGVFHQPIGVWIDIAALGTLADREYRSGLAEVVKYGVILDADFFAYLENNVSAILQREPAVLAGCYLFLDAQYPFAPAKILQPMKAGSLERRGHFRMSDVRHIMTLGPQSLRDRYGRTYVAPNRAYREQHPCHVHHPKLAA